MNKVVWVYATVAYMCMLSSTQDGTVRTDIDRLRMTGPPSTYIHRNVINNRPALSVPDRYILRQKRFDDVVINSTKLTSVFQLKRTGFFRMYPWVKTSVEHMRKGGIRTRRAFSELAVTNCSGRTPRSQEQPFDDELTHQSKNCSPPPTSQPDEFVGDLIPFNATHWSNGLRYAGNFPVVLVDPHHENRPDVRRMLRLYNESEELARLLEVIGNMCSGWTPCIESELKDPKCCLKCRCEQECIFTHDCCPGFTPNKTKVVRNPDMEPVCRKALLFSNGTGYNERKIRDYEFVNRCLKTVVDTSLIEMCSWGHGDGEHGGANYEFNDIVAVTHVNKGVNFANRHCAVCNDIPEDELEFWVPEISCNGPLDVKEVETLAHTVMQTENCVVKLLPPKNVDVNHTICFPDVISGCNETGNWSAYDSETEMLCDSLDWVYSAPNVNLDLPERRWYRNIFCAVCNGENIHVPRETFCHYSDVGYLRHPYIFSLLNYARAPMDRPAIRRGLRCPTGKRFDPLLKRCHRVFCTFPMVYIPLDDKCMEMYGEINYGMIRASFEINPKEPIPVHNIDNIQATLTVNLKQELDFPAATCDLHAFFFKTGNPTSDKDMGEINTENLLLKSVIMVIEYEIKFIGNPVKKYENVTHSILNTNWTILGDVREIRQRTAYSYLTTDLLKRNSEYMETAIGDTLQPILEDPSDGATILGNNNSFNLSIYNNCLSESHFLIDDSLMECLTFVYDIHADGIKHFEDGIVFTKQHISFGFHQFRCLNRTHCAVCVDDVINAVTTSAASLMSVYKMCELFLVIMFSLIF